MRIERMRGQQVGYAKKVLAVEPQLRDREPARSPLLGERADDTPNSAIAQEGPWCAALTDAGQLELADRRIDG